jgi:hypothetical protein
MVHVYIRDNHLFTSRNAQTLPEMVYPPISPLGPPDAFRMRGLEPRYPQIAYTPVDVRFQGRLAGRLASNGPNLPIEQHHDQWTLKDSVKKSWIRLEHVLKWITLTLLHVHKDLPTDFDFYPIPSRWGYKDTYPGLSQAHRHAKRSRDAFVPLMAMASMAIAMFDADVHGYQPAWVTHLSLQKGFCLDWLDMLRESQVGDLTIPRVGVVFKAESNYWLRWAGTMERNNVPVWIYWGRNDGVLVADPALDAWRPSATEMAPHCDFWRRVVEAPFVGTSVTDLTGWQIEEPVRDEGPAVGWGAAANTGWGGDQSTPNTGWGGVDNGWGAAAKTGWNTSVTTDWIDPATHKNRVPTPPRQPAARTILTWPDMMTKRALDNLTLSLAIPKPNKGTGQKFGETWQQFFARRAAHNARVDARSTTKERAQREQRRREHGKYQQPGRRGPTVYHWAEINGFWIRTVLERNRVEDYWGDYFQSQMIYDSFSNEWDLCRAMPAHGQLPLDDWMNDEVEGEDYVDMVPYNERTRRSVCAVPNEPDDSATDSRDLAQEVPVNRESLDRIMFYRLGFVWLDRLAGTNSQPVSDLVWTKTLKLLADHGSSVDEMMKPSIVDFVQCFMAQPPVLPVLVWDLHSTCPRRITRDVIRLVVSTIIWRGTAPNTIPPAPWPNSHLIGDGQLDDVAWLLTVDDPLHVLECIRRGLGPGTLTIIRHFLSKGIAFHTWLVSSLGSIPASIPPRVALGFRPINFTPSLTDYVAYEDRRDAFLSGPRGRAALMRGGIVWRLAKEAASSDSVLLGPSDEASAFGIFKTAASGLLKPDTLVYDDTLSRDEMDLICGVYAVANGQFPFCFLVWRSSEMVLGRSMFERPAEQTTDMSWWPKNSTWNNSSLNVGYWSTGCEEWFQRRLANIRDGTATLKTTAKWTSALRILGKTSRVLASQRELAVQLLN